ncbi:MAG TPA: sugar phosphate nucleotidyltransferase [Candidatus Sumerlaeota bacterium]|nr:sugar phosphate nucleotidyltransferase [Candidatus Sumerlaeota bacterium]HON50068.1 sugar phosphate nucleotidyltransferase [Candidatus Sumerlaeota bacterium]HOR63284.1 sugar phosphate nucleotidyltransferase [Candidatus Sumerlaeota bacterium]HPL74035.1 sugar phosphate nucleotidyltransferase [Candidatus Sumerlaeota bacterium]HRU55432.1 sugar phosphate nucleotidyltransferase [Candidatus Sumerlaeia bacterium]
MSNTAALVLAGGNVEGYGVLTYNRTKAALPFAGHYRIIDFALSNLSNSGIAQVGVITQYLPASLIEHVAGGEAWDFRGSGRIVKIMPPFVGVGQTTWFQGTTDAVYRNLNFIYDLNPDDVIILSGEHIYCMDYSKVLQMHREKNADLTVVGKKLPKERLSHRFGYIQKNGDNRVTLFKEKPKELISDFISIGIYIFKRDVLLNEINMRRQEARFTQNFVIDIVEPITQKMRAFVFEFDGFWEYLENVNKYYETNMKLLDEKPPIDLVNSEIVTNLEDRGLGSRFPGYIGNKARLENSMISPGCRIEGNVIRSILSPGVVLEEDAVIEDSILMHDCVVQKGARIQKVLADKNVIFCRNCSVGGEMHKDKKNPEIPDSPLGLSIMGKGAIIGDDIKIGGLSQVYPGMDLRTYAGTHFAPGVNIK